MVELRTDSRLMMDQIIYYKTGHFSVEAGKLDGERVEVEFAHNLPFTPLIFGVYATTPDFADAKDFNVQFGAVSVNLFADEAKIHGMVYNFSGQNIEFYYRIYGFEPSNSSEHLQTTAGDAHGFIINSGKFNYRKLYQAGIADIQNNQATILHGLGYRPQVMLWQEWNDGAIEPFSESLGGNRAIVNDTSLTVSSTMKRVHYRIYYDEVH